MILLTRPYNESKESAAKLSALGHKTSILPLFEIEYLDITLTDNSYDAVIITSKHAAQVAAKYDWIKHKKLFIVGQQVAKCSTWNIFESIGKDSDQLFESVQNKLRDKSSILYICGNHIANNLDKKLIDAGYILDKKEVYISTPIKNISLPEGINKILFYSPRTAELFSSQFQQNLQNIDAICISKNTANKLNPNLFKSVIIAPQPNEDSLFSLL